MSLCLMCQRHNVTVAQRVSFVLLSFAFYFLLILQCFPLSSAHPLFSSPFHFPTRVNSSRFNSSGLFHFTMSFFRPLFAVPSRFNVRPLHFIAYHVKTSYLADYGFIQRFVLIPFSFALLSFAFYLTKLFISNSTGFPLTHFALSDNCDHGLSVLIL